MLRVVGKRQPRRLDHSAGKRLEDHAQKRIFHPKQLKLNEKERNKKRNVRNNVGNPA